MPLFDFECRRCRSVFETIVGSSEDEGSVRCPGCGGGVNRQAISRFSVIGGSTRTSDAALAATGGDFISDPDKFVTAMDTFGESIGDRLTSRQKEKAVENLKQARR